VEDANDQENGEEANNNGSNDAVGRTPPRDQLPNKSDKNSNQ
jgi:hypothetical protein